MYSIIIVTGTPCTGKTTIAKRIASILKFKYIDANRLIKISKIHDKYDKKSDSLIVDIKKLNKVLETLIKNSNKNLIIDSHLSHYLPNKLVGLCIVTKCDLKILADRLKKRKYNLNKIRENIDSEIFDICLNEAIENNHNIMIIDTSKKINFKNIIKKIH
ncbi:MAG TPA: adenylate kinase family protein [Candidatus Nanoarchaeia archaeon]|nr:adenylate kinase family protein [Candidatus Nanoarchaeia archaeon]